MRTIEVPQQEWRRTLDEFSTVHDGWLVSLDILAPGLGAQHQIHDLPLRGITAENDSRGGAIVISAARGDGEQITHIIHAPSSVRIERTNEGGDVALEIGSDEGAAILRFKTVAIPLTVDGMPRRGR
jgi:hypothetical protein